MKQWPDQKLTLLFNAVLSFDLADAKVAAPSNIASINQKIEGKPIEAAPVAKPAPKVMDLFETLRASVEAAKRPEAEEPAPKRKRKAA